MSDLLFLSPPRMTREAFAGQLAAWRSPAAPEADACFSAVAAEGVDPAIGLAFFWHESQAATDPAYAKGWLKNPGNIKGTWGHVVSRDASGFAGYATWAEGFAGWAKLIRGLYVEAWGLTTPRAALVKYAPSSDGNRPAAYATAVERMVAQWAAAGGPAPNPWARWGNEYPLPPDQWGFAIPQAWLAKSEQLGPAISEEVHYPHFGMAIRWFVGGLVVWYQGWDRGVVVTR